MVAWPWFWFWFWAWFCAQTLARRILHPEVDSFYQPAPGFENSLPGDILKWRRLSNPIGTYLYEAYATATFQIQFRTRSAEGDPMAAITTVMVPYNADLSKMATHQVAEDSAWIGCSPSYTVQMKATDPLTAQFKLDTLFMDIMLRQGWIVNMPDHEGPQSAFGANRQAGYLVLDSIRAVLTGSGQFTGIDPDARVTLSGYSGGSMAAGWAAELHPTYYPELNLAGVVLGGFVPDVRAITMHLNKGPFAGLVVAALLGTSTAYRDGQELLNEQIMPDRLDDVRRVTSQCMFENMLSFRFDDIFSWFYDGDDMMHNETFLRLLQDNCLGNVAPEVPVLIYHGKHDQIAPLEACETAFDQYCRLGANVELYVDLTADHLLAMFAGFPRVLSFLKSCLNGDKARSGTCRRHEVVSNVMPSDLWGEDRQILRTLYEVFSGRSHPA